MKRTEKPIIFSGPMVRAILAGNKTQTRRVIRFPKGLSPHWYHGPTDDGLHDFMFGAIDQANRMAIDWSEFVKAPYAPGDVLWVRETFAQIRNIETGHVDTFYAANKKDCDTVNSTYLCDDDGFETDRHIPWKPSIYMPREAARIFLCVKDVRVERVQDITEADADAEGAAFYSPKFKTDVATIPWRMTTSRTKFCALWDSIYAKRGYGWDKNPWVWVIAFERIGDPLQDELNAGADAAHQQVLRSAT